jgi:hypothetical protein
MKRKKGDQYTFNEKDSIITIALFLFAAIIN